MMQNDFPRWKAFVERVIGGGGEEEEEADKTAVRGAELARKGDGAGGQASQYCQTIKNS